MYKLLLSWRYLRTRYIALASIISVTLGVATLIVVNSVMSGFTNEMHKRLHGILSDIELTSTGMDHIYDPQWHMAEIEKVIGDDLEGMTAIVRVPAMLHFQFNGRTFTQQIMLIGVDELTYAQVSDIRSYLLHPENREQLRFMLREDGYDQRLPPSGWEHRRKWVGAERHYQEELRRLRAEYDSDVPPPIMKNVATKEATKEPTFAALPDLPPELHASGEDLSDKQQVDTSNERLFEKVDPFAAARPNGQPGETFDEMKEQHTGLILGVAITSMRRRNPETNQAEDVFFRLPGDNVQITLPSAGVPPQPISANFTIVDFYESKMHEYDSQFAFMPIDKLQQLRGMIDPQTGIGSVSSIQIKLKAGADLLAVKRKLQLRFPPNDYPYRVQTWQDIQGPLLSAVRLETTILNILLFLIITVAGFGILATFFMIVVEKTRDIGILKALGAPSRGVMSIFLTYGFSLGVVGSGAGIVIGLLFVTNINGIAKLIERVTNQEVFDPTVYYFNEIPTIINPITITWVAIGATLIAVLASVLPAIPQPVYTLWRHCDMSNSIQTDRTAAAKQPGDVRAPHFPMSAVRRENPNVQISKPIILSAKGIKKSYHKAKIEIPVLRHVDFEARKGEFTAIIGQSGSGKSTLLHVLGTLDQPDAGEVHFEGNRIDNLPSVSRDILRNRHFGMIFQFYHLLPELTMLENVLIPNMVARGAIRYWLSRRKFKECAKHLLDLVGLSHRLSHKPRELSGGEMQRTAIARALMANPQLLLADEPTGNLDGKTGRDILAILHKLHQEEKLTMIMVTHDHSVADQADRTVRLVEGRFEDA